MSIKAHTSAQKEILGEIMATDIFVKISSVTHQREVEVDIEKAIGMFRDFGKRFSRFEIGNELWRFNQSESIKVSDDLFRLLSLSKEFYKQTGGLFNPSILPVLEREGYVVGKQHGFASEERRYGDGEVFSLDALELDASTLTVSKPKALKIDLGGIGKGYIIDKVAGFLQEKYTHFLVNAGGDIMAHGNDLDNGYTYWAVDVESPVKKVASLPYTLLLRNQAVATSGTSRRKWVKEGKEKHHLIHPLSRTSLDTEIVSVTVLARTATDADVWAKALFLLGKEEGMMRANALQIPVLYIDKQGNTYPNSLFEAYAWTE